MTISQLYLLFHVLFMIGIIILCMVVGMPTRYWWAVAAWLRHRLLNSKGKKLQKALALQGEEFLSDESFLDRGVGLAIDHKRGLVFLAEPDGKHYQTAVLPKSQLGEHRMVVQQADGFHHFFVEISETGTAPRKWRLPCADSELADEINRKLNKAF